MEYVEDMNELGRNLCDMRRDRNLSQSKVADMIFVDRSTYAYYETGRTYITIFDLIKLAKVYNVDIRYFLLKGGERNVLR